MNSVFDKIIEKLEENASRYTKKYVTPYGNNGYRDIKAISVHKAIEIVKQEAEQYNNGWISCSVALPPQTEENPIFDNKPLELYLVSVKNAYYPIRAFWNGKFFTDGWSKVDVIAWQPLPHPYTKGE